MADVREGADGEEYIACGIDYGTSSVSVSFCVYRGNNTRVTDIDHVRAGDGTPLIQSHVAYYEGQFYHGLDLSLHLEGIKKPKVPAGNVILCVKLALYEDYEGTDMETRIKRVHQQLKEAGKELDELLEDHLRAILTMVRHEITHDQNLAPQFTAEKLSSMPLRFRLSVPQMWSPLACSKMQAAAKRAGMDTVTLASEPECALASAIDELSQETKSISPRLGPGDHLLIADLGCGTNDYALVRLTDAINVASQIDAIKESSGALGASQKINEILLSRHEESMGGEAALEAECIKLKITKHEFRWQALREIELMKLQFPNRARYCGHVLGLDSEDHRLLVSKPEMQEVYDIVMVEVFRCIDAYMIYHPRLLFVAGGFGKSSYLTKELRQRYSPADLSTVGPGGQVLVMTPFKYRNGECLMVSDGALSARYQHICSQQLPTGYGYALLQDEYYDKDLHPDACIKVSRMKKATGTRYDVRVPKMDTVVTPGVVFNSIYGSRMRHVGDRLKPFLRKGDVVSTTDVEISVPQQYWVNVKDAKIHKDFVILTQDYKEHEPARNVDGKFRDGVRYWKRANASIDEKVLREGGFKVVEDPNGKKGKKYYEVTAQLFLRYKKQQDLTVWWKLIPEHGDSTAIWEDKKVLWNASHSEFREGPASVK